MHKQVNLTLPSGNVIQVDKGLEGLIYQVNRIFPTVASCIGGVSDELQRKGIRNAETVQIVWAAPKGMSTIGFFNACWYFEVAMFTDETAKWGRTSLELSSGVFPWPFPAHPRGWLCKWRLPEAYISEWADYLKRTVKDGRVLLRGNHVAEARRSKRVKKECY